MFKYTDFQQIELVVKVKTTRHNGEKAFNI